MAESFYDIFGNPDPESTPDRPLNSFADIFSEDSPPAGNVPVWGPMERLNPQSQIGKSFFSGVGTELRRPLNFALGESEPEFTPDTPGEMLSNVVGSFVGMGIGFVPFVGGAGIALKGVGLTAKIGKPLARFISNVTGVAAYEAGTATTLEEAGEKAAIGAGLGLAFEGIMLSRATKMRSAVKRAQNEVAAPDIVAIETMMSPRAAMNPVGAAKRISALGDEAAQWDEVAASIGAFSGTNGMVILPRMQEPGRVIRELKQRLPGIGVGSRTTDEGTEVLLAFPEFQSRLMTDPSIPKSVRDRLAQISKEGGELTEDEIIQIIEAPHTGRFAREKTEIVPTVNLASKIPGLSEFLQSKSRTGKLRGLYMNLVNYNDPIPLGSIGIDDVKGLFVDEAQKLAVIVHEYAHALTHVSKISAVTGEKIPNQLFDLGIEEIVKDAAPEFLDALQSGLNNFGRSRLRLGQLHRLDPKKDALNPLLNGFLDLSAIGRIGGEFSAKKFKTSRRFIKTGWEVYYGHDTELIARGIQALFLHPEQAVKYAPQASKILRKYIQKHSPKLQMIFGDTAPEVKQLDELLNFLWKQKPGEDAEFFLSAAAKLTKKQTQRFKESGFVSGMSVRYRGKEYEAVGGSWRAAKSGQMKIRDPKTGEVLSVAASKVERPLLPEMVRMGVENEKKLLRLLKENPSWVGFVVERADQTLQRGAVGLENFVFVETLAENGTKLSPHAKIFQEYRKEILGETGDRLFGRARLPGPQPYTLDDQARVAAKIRARSGLPLGPQGSKKTNLLSRKFSGPEGPNYSNIDVRQQVDDWLEAQGAGGIVEVENGQISRIILRNEDAITYGERLSPGLGVTVDRAGVEILEDGTEVIREIIPSYRNRAESVLRQSGATDAELEYFFKQGEASIWPELKKMLSEDFVKLEQTAIAASKASGSKTVADEAIEHVAARSNLQTRETLAGEIEILSDDGVRLATVATKAEAETYISRAAQNTSGVPKTLDDGAQIPSGAEPTGAPVGGAKPKIQEQLSLYETMQSEKGRKGLLTRSRKYLNTMNIFMPWMTGMEQVAKSIENLGNGRAWAKVFRPIDRAMTQVDNEFQNLVRPRLGNKSFAQALEEVDKSIIGMTRKEQEDIVRYIEYLTRQEIEQAGGFMQRAMSPEELSLAREVVGVGLQNDVPRVMQLRRMLDLTYKNQDDLITKVLPKIDAELQAGNWGEEAMAFRQRLVQMTEEFSTYEEMLDFFEVPDAERWLISKLKAPPSSDKNVFSWAAVARWAAAPELKAGFASGREQFAAQVGLNGKQLRAAGIIDDVLREAFEESGLDAKRMLSGYWPHMRQWIEQGGLAKEYQGLIPDRIDWLSNRILTGEIDVYRRHPLLTTLSHVRGLLMHKHVDPLLPEAKQVIKQITLNDERLGRIMSQYIQQVTGRPHDSFRRLNATLQSIGKALGVNVDSRLGERFIGVLQNLAYKASIPFRPALILRNYMQMVQMTLPRVGPDAFETGLRRALTKEGFNEAVKAGAIDLNVLPVFASTEIMGMQTARLTETMHPMIAKMGREFEELFEMGFNWYRKPDDLGRAAAYHAMRHRMNKAGFDDLIAGKLDLETFKSRAKINTFDESAVRLFDEMIGEGKVEEARNLLGVELARETHFRYGHANHPSGWGSVWGRLFGQFGTFPVQYKDFLFQSMTRGSLKDRVETLAGHSAINAGIVAGGAAAGVNLWGWITFPSLQYTGGPYADIAVNLYQAWGGNDSESRLAKRNLKYLFPLPEHPQSMFVPGSYLIGDIADAMDETDFSNFLFEAGGFKFYDYGERWTDPAEKFAEKLLPEWLMN